MQKTPAVVDLLDKVTDHAFGNVEIRDHPVAQRAYGNDVGRRFPQHALGLGANGQDVSRIFFDRDDGGLAQNNPLSLDINKGIGRSQVNTHVVTKETEEIVEHYAMSFKMPISAPSDRRGPFIINCVYPPLRSLYRCARMSKSLAFTEGFFKSFATRRRAFK